MSLEYSGFSADPALIPATLRGFRSWSCQRYHNPDCYTKSVILPDRLGASYLPCDCVRSYRDEHNQVSITGMYSHRWYDLELTASCSKYNIHEQVPSEDCTCGIYARYSPPPVTEISVTTPIIYGVVEASGKTILGSTGFRTEHAKIVAFYVPGRLPRFMEKFYTNYFIPSFPNVPFITSLEELVEKFPPEDLSALGIQHQHFYYDAVIHARDAFYLEIMERLCSIPYEQRGKKYAISPAVRFNPVQSYSTERVEVETLNYAEVTNRLIHEYITSLEDTIKSENFSQFLIGNNNNYFQYDNWVRNYRRSLFSIKQQQQQRLAHITWCGS